MEESPEKFHEYVDSKIEKRDKQYQIHLLKIRQNTKKIMKARFSGKCVECEEAIKVGKEILKNSKGQWVHAACSDSEEELP